MIADLIANNVKCQNVTEIRQGKEYRYCESVGVFICNGVPLCKDHALWLADA